MEKIGFIGYGAMGRMIVKGIISSGALKESEMIITSRTPNKLLDLQKKYSGVEIAQDNITLARKSKKIFLFVNTSQVKGLLEEISDYISVDTHIIYIAAGLTLKTIGKKFQGKISKVMPSITSEVNLGISLVAHNQQVGQEDAEFVEDIFKAIGKVKIVEEDQFGLGADLTSSAPAFISAIMMKFMETSLKHGCFTRDEVEEMVTDTLYGTAKLLQEKDIGFEDVINQVATKGGITEEGLKVLEEKILPIFDEIFGITLKKYEITEKELNNQYKT